MADQGWIYKHICQLNSKQSVWPCLISIIILGAHCSCSLSVMRNTESNKADPLRRVDDHVSPINVLRILVRWKMAGLNSAHHRWSLSDWASTQLSWGGRFSDLLVIRNVKHSHRWLKSYWLEVLSSIASNVCLIGQYAFVFCGHFNETQFRPKGHNCLRYFVCLRNLLLAAFMKWLTTLLDV